MNSSACLNRLSFCVLAGGSSGNSVFVSDAKTKILVDAGLSGKETEKRLESIGQNPSDITAIVISHEHIDHIKGVGVLSRRYKIPVYSTKKTFLASETTIKNVHEKKFINSGTPFFIDDLRINPFSISHDAADPCGFTIKTKDSKLGIATDLGIATSLVRTRLKSCNGIVLESNHDPELLANGSYPWSVKQRIKSRSGHLSNKEARDLIGEVIDSNLSNIILSHISGENNCHQLALDTVAQAAKDFKTNIESAYQEKPSSLFHI